jgi:hypothetical protein
MLLLALVPKCCVVTWAPSGALPMTSQASALRPAQMTTLCATGTACQATVSLCRSVKMLVMLQPGFVQVLVQLTQGLHCWR